jgi:hypothetical protein
LHILSPAAQPPSEPPSGAPLELDAVEEELLLALELVDSPPAPELLELLALEELVEAPPAPPIPPTPLLDEVVELVDEELVLLLLAALEELLDELLEELEDELLEAVVDAPPPAPPVPDGIRLRSTDVMSSHPPAPHTMMPPIARASALLLRFIGARIVCAGPDRAQASVTKRRPAPRSCWSRAGRNGPAPLRSGLGGRRFRRARKPQRRAPPRLR